MNYCLDLEFRHKVKSSMESKTNESQRITLCISQRVKERGVKKRERRQDIEICGENEKLLVK